MSSLSTIATTILSFGVVIINSLTLFFVYLIFFTSHFSQSRSNFSQSKKSLEYLVSSRSTQTVLICFLAALCAVLGSLLYSNIIGYVPCELCWWQRIFLYPQVILFGVALFLHNRHKKSEEQLRSGYLYSYSYEYVFITSLTLSVIGGAIALYHYYGQTFNPDALPACAVNGVSCAKLYFVSFGYITLPFMSLSIFAFLITLAVIALRSLKSLK